ncbi:MAG TPA: ATP-binding protein, partial [Thermoleophilaceae bacterium]|nr:ATP-binding protein [Thermoleophilaceae bacterium]
MDLVGRETELDTLARAVRDVRAGARRVVVLWGEPGIGKTSLVAAASAAAERAGLFVLAGRAAEHERDTPYGFVVDALDDHVASMGPGRLRAAGPEL